MTWLLFIINNSACGRYDSAFNPWNYNSFLKFLRWTFSIDKNQLICILFDQNRYFYYLNFSKSHISYTFCAWEFWFFSKNVFCWQKQINFCSIWAKKNCFCFLVVQKNSVSDTCCADTGCAGKFQNFAQKCVLTKAN